MDFINNVRAAKIVGPLRRGFSAKQWNDAYLKSEQDRLDLKLFEAGLLIFDRANDVRKHLKITFATDLPATTKLRVFVALANYNFCMLQARIEEELPSTRIGKDTVLAPAILGIKVKLRSGSAHSPDELVQTFVDSTQVPIKAILESQPNLRGAPKFARLEWSDVFSEANLAELYSHLESLWDHCLWNGYQPIQRDGGIAFEPENVVWSKRLEGSRYRGNNLSIQFMDVARSQLAAIDRNALSTLIGSREVRGIRKEQRKQQILLSPRTDAISPAAERLLAFRLLATEPYYMELMRAPLEGLARASIDDLLAGWEVISQIAEIQREEIFESTISDNMPPHIWVPKYGHLLQIESAERAIADAVGLGYAAAKSSLAFLIFRGNPTQELWAQPLIPVSEKAVVPLFPALVAPNLARLVDVWMKQLGVDLSRRGPAFEKYVRTEIKDAIDHSLILSDARVLAEDFKFRPIDEREEQIDVVIALEDLVLIGEAKCIVHPTEAKEYAMHRNTVVAAAEQIRRKQSSVARHLIEFREQLRLRGVEVPTNLRVEPFVILNGPIHAGFEIDSVPIVDLTIIKVFLDGRIRDVAMRTPDGSIKELATTVLYRDPAEAARIATAYLSSPPQLDFIWKSIQDRWVPVARVQQSEKPWAYLTHECAPNFDFVTSQFKEKTGGPENPL